MGQRENAVVDACLTLLVRYGGCFAWRQNSGGIRLPGREGKERFVSFGGIRGAADIVGVIGKGPHKGRAIAVECKAPAPDPVLEDILIQDGRKKRRGEGGRQSKFQKDWQAMFEEAGGLYVLAWRSEQLEKVLIEHQVIERDPRPGAP